MSITQPFVQTMPVTQPPAPVGVNITPPDLAGTYARVAAGNAQNAMAQQEFEHIKAQRAVGQWVQQNGGVIPNDAPGVNKMISDIAAMGVSPEAAMNVVGSSIAAQEKMFNLKMMQDASEWYQRVGLGGQGANPGLQSPVTSTPQGDPGAGGVSQYAPLIQSFGQKAGLTPQQMSLIPAIMSQESGGNQWAKGDNKNGTSDHGLMQINDSNMGLLQPGENVYDPATNIRIGTQLWAQALQQAGGDTAKALQIYNSGKPNGNPAYAASVLSRMTPAQAANMPASGLLASGAATDQATNQAPVQGQPTPNIPGVLSGMNPTMIAQMARQMMASGNPILMQRGEAMLKAVTAQSPQESVQTDAQKAAAVANASMAPDITKADIIARNAAQTALTQKGSEQVMATQEGARTQMQNVTERMQRLADIAQNADASGLFSGPKKLASQIFNALGLGDGDSWLAQTKAALDKQGLDAATEGKMMAQEMANMIAQNTGMHRGGEWAMELAKAANPNLELTPDQTRAIVASIIKPLASQHDQAAATLGIKTGASDLNQLNQQTVDRYAPIKADAVDRVNQAITAAQQAKQGAPAGQSGNAGAYRAPEDVRADMRAGKINPNQAQAILKQQWPSIFGAN